MQRGLTACNLLSAHTTLNSISIFIAHSLTTPKSLMIHEKITSKLSRGLQMTAENFKKSLNIDRRETLSSLQPTHTHTLSIYLKMSIFCLAKEKKFSPFYFFSLTRFSTLIKNPPRSVRKNTSPSSSTSSLSVCVQKWCEFSVSSDSRKKRRRISC